MSFFKGLERRQAAPTEEVMAAWTDEEERRVALALGEALQRQWSWPKPYFLPEDRVIALIGGPEVGVFLELDLADAFEEFNEPLGVNRGREFWETVVDWSDKDGRLRELVRKITAELKRMS